MQSKILTIGLVEDFAMVLDNIVVVVVTADATPD